MFKTGFADCAVVVLGWLSRSGGNNVGCRIKCSDSGRSQMFKAGFADLAIMGSGTGGSSVGCRIRCSDSGQSRMFKTGFAVVPRGWLTGNMDVIVVKRFPE